jgi:cation diffusion facilitator CzcD-associated flavoprotein CzcO
MLDAAIAPDVSTAVETADVLIIGTGFSGLCMAIKQQDDGNRDFLILDEAQEVGGTWRDNHYPGCACDIPSHLYSLSFAPKADWSRMYPSQPEIFAYMRDVAARFGLRDKIRFGAKMQAAAWDDARAVWVVRTQDGRHFEGRVLACGMGGLHVPLIPEYPGHARFAGPRFHSAAWDHGVDLTGKRVAVIGTGASAIQFVPEVAKQAGQLYLFQRTPPWIIPRPDYAFSEAQLRRLKNPLFRRLFRTWIYILQEIRAPAFLGSKRLAAAGQKMARDHLARQIRKPALRQALMPDYTMGCKRVLLSNDYYPALSRENAEVVTRSISEIRPDAIVTQDGRVREVDVIIYGTGFHTTDSLSALDITGRNGVTLREVFSGGMHAYWGITVPGFPNLFLMMGPNTGLGHNSMVLMIEAQVRYSMSVLRGLRAKGWRAADVRADMEAAFNTKLQGRLARTVWQTGGCRSWYQDENGKNTTLWPGYTFSYVWGTRKAKLGEYEKVK